MSKIRRRGFLKSASIAAAAAGVGAINSCSTEKKNESASIHTQKKYEWRMVTSWPPKFPILGEYAELIAKWIDEMSSGRLKIQVYGSGELVPAFEVFDAVSLGAAEMGHAAAYYWAGKAPAAQFFATVPFGMTARQMNAWLYFGGGLELWRELYSDFNLVPFPCGNTGGQMGGWYNREMNSVNDLDGLKIRMPGLGGKVITKAGATTVLSPGGELYTNLERGVIDGLEWIGPYHDYLMGFHKIAKYYYYPGWHEPCANLELTINKDAYSKLPTDLKAIVKTAAQASNVMILSAFDVKNFEYFEKLKNEEEVAFRKFPNKLLLILKTYADEVFEEISETSTISRKVFESYDKFQKKMNSWHKISERE
ncbi:MAG: TRAP transporter substrate-binding protein [Ignavibacteria bacterium]|nr:TRAP transporter substrate-binding protein [Ignavibacteria bacterium]MBT8381384.1 TRAP transporter substrate-binding protein [Ignavibacteria bacterium]NNL21454.1 TRAP transporter substrate-binding protein [Ignavibacteriaceae bacterium]